MREKLFLIDGTALLYRSFFAFKNRPLINSKGMNTSAIYGTINIFLKLVEKFETQNVIISFDRKEKTFRHELSKLYKANRPPMPDELVAQIEPVKEFFKLIKIPEISFPGFEADDVLATLAYKFKKQYDIVIVSGDKDFAQLVNDRINLYDPSKDKSISSAEILEKYGIKPSQFIDYLAICGDSADNIPGVKGIGPKGASKLLQEYDNLENIYVNIENISSKSIKNKLIESKENAFLSQTLAKIEVNVPIKIEKVAEFHERNLKYALPFLKNYELRSIEKKIIPKREENHFQMEFDFGMDELESENQQKLPFKTIIVDDPEKLAKLSKYLKAKKYIAIDTETTNIDPFRADLVGISICADEEKAYYLPIAHRMANNLPLEKTLQILSETLDDKELIAHNFKYDFIVFKNAGWEIENNFFDTIIAHYLLYPLQRHSLANCAKQEFEYEMIPISDLIGKGKKMISFDFVDVQKAAEYSAEDSYITFKLFNRYQKLLENNDLYTLFRNIELPLVKVLAFMEENGVWIDENILTTISVSNNKKIANFIDKIYEIAGYQFNINSTQQLSKLLFEEMQIKPIKKIKSGYSTDISVLEKLSKDHEIARILIEYRQLAKLESTYVKALSKLINPRTGKIHSSFNQTVASTGRLSSSKPNLQNIPIRTREGREIRKAFAAKDDAHLILAADYSQIELRLLAILSQDEKMVASFNSGKDIHSQTASLIFNLPQKEISKEQRRYAKIINFGLIYGMGAFRISNELHISHKEATEFIKNYFDKFPTIKTFIDESVHSAKIKGYAETILHRKLYLPDLNSSNKQRVKEAERVAVNMPIQGSAADIIKIAMINIHKRIKNNPHLKMLIQVHDELVFEIEKSFLTESINIIKMEMENALPDSFSNIVPLSVDIGYGKNWFEAH